MINPFQGRKDLFGKPLDRNALEQLLAKQDDKDTTQEQARQENLPSAQNSGINLDDYVILEPPRGASYSYAPLFVPLKRTHFNKDWNTAHASLRAEGAHMLTIRQFADFLKLLRSGDAYDGKGNRMQNALLYQCYNDLTEVRSPWRAEWLNATFSKAQVGKTLGVFPKTQMQITYHVLDNGRSKEVTEPLADCLMRDATPGINLDHWLDNATAQGFPADNTEVGKLYYWSPRDKAVAGFDADSLGAVLGCVWDPRVSCPGLGVRAARVKI